MRHLLGARRWLLVLALLTPVALFTYRCYNPSPPDRAEAARIVEGLGGGQLLAFEVIEGVPHVVYRGRDRVQLDHLRSDPISIEWPPTPRWQLDGNPVGIVNLRGPATAVRASCSGRLEDCGGDFEVFGTIGAPEVVSLEVVCAETRLEFPVAAPAFVARVDASCATPLEYRWLDASGEVVWGQAAD